MLVCADLLMLRVVLTLLFVWVVEGTVPGMSGFGKLGTWEGSEADFSHDEKCKIFKF